MSKIKLPAIPEDALQQWCVRYVKLSFPNCEVRAGMEAGSRAPSAWYKKMGLQAGWPDLVLHWAPAKVGFVELKNAATGKLSDAQRVKISRLSALGYPVAICATQEEFQDVLKWWGVS